VTVGQAIEWLYDPSVLPGRDHDEQACWAALLLAQMRGPWGGVA
jgi:hypothetical protein